MKTSICAIMALVNLTFSAFTQGAEQDTTATAA